MLLRFATGDFSIRETPSSKGDEIDAIIVGLNTIGEETQASGKFHNGYESRISDLLEVLLRYTLLDFSVKAKVSKEGDEIDAVAVGLNTLGEELEAKIRAEKKYSQDLEKLAIILETTADAVVTTDPSGTFVTWNKSAERIYGYSAAEILGKYSITDLTPDAQKENLRSVFQNVRSGEQVIDFHALQIRKDGSIINVSITLTPIINENHEVLAISGISRDITEQKKAEQALKESEERFRLLVEEVKDYSIFMLDPQGNIISWNKGAEAMKGYSAGEVIGKNFSMFYTPGELDRNEPAYNLSMAAEKGRYETEGWRSRKDGTLFWADVIFTALYNDKHELRGFAKITRDITERKKTEQQIQEAKEQIETVINNAPSSVVVINEEGNIINWNSKSELVFGWKAEEVIGKPMHQIIMPQRYVSAHHEGVHRFLGTGTGPVINKTIEISAIRRSGNEFPIELSISATKSKGKYLFIAFINDITERKLADEKVKSLNRDLQVNIEKLESANKELEAFTYSVSHDLRAPLRAIHGYSNILMDEAGLTMSSETKKMLNSIVFNAKKMGQLIDDLLAFSRLGKKEMQKTRTDMNEIVKEVLSELRKIDPMKAEIIVKPLPEAFVDHNLMLQVYTNLISNAIKYSSHQERPKIEIGSLSKDSETIYYVKDNGVGFNMQYYDKLFGVFQRLHDPNEYEGTGVGLALVKRIILRHEGRVWAESEEGKGATFYFTLKQE
jgi:PAS domain S-box-containing protein